VISLVRPAQKREARHHTCRGHPRLGILAKEDVDGRNKSGHDEWMDEAMNYWLVKSEPSTWSWDQQVAKGAKGEAWTGVRNFTARQNLVKMKKGDRAFFYHSNEGKEIVGIVEIIKEAYPDPTDKTEKFVCVDIKADKKLKSPVTMAAIKADKKLAEMALVKYSRLSVQPVTAEEWKAVCKMAGM
jgi:predicted RNA-binding protein with PUA-like domain